MERAIAQSIKDLQQPKRVSMPKFYDPQDFDTPEERMRQEGVPVGLVNIGNSTSCVCDPVACYFNSLLQTYFKMPVFVETIMKFSPSPDKKEDNEPRSPE